MSAGQFNQVDPAKTEPQNIINTSFRTYNFDVIDGVTYELDITQPNKYSVGAELVNPTANRVRNLRYQGQEVADDQLFIVVTNNYRASGPFPGVKDAQENRLLNLQNRQALIDYIIAEKTIDARPNQNWTFADTIKDLDLRFLTSLKGQEHLASNPAISFVGISEALEGFGEYRYHYSPVLQPVEPEQPEQPAQPEQPEKPAQPEVTPLTPAKPAKVETVKGPQVLSYQSGQTFQKVASSQPQVKEQAVAGQLPKTGSEQSLLMSFGLVLLGLLPKALLKGKQD